MIQPRLAPSLIALTLGAMAIGAAASAHAQVAAPEDRASAKVLLAEAVAGAPRRLPGASADRPLLSLSDFAVASSRAPGVAKTEVDHAFAHGGAVGSLGFLCGLDDRASDGPTGRDAHGRFLGAQLSLPFR